MTAFYQRVLGFGVYAQQPDEQPTIVFLRVGDDASCPARDGSAHPVLLVLIDPARHPPAAGKFDVPTRRSSTLNHIAFDIDADSYESECDRLAALGVETMRVDFPDLGARAVFFKDPEDNTVELICRDAG